MLACDLNSVMFRNAKTPQILQMRDCLGLFACDIFVSCVVTASPTHLLVNNLKKSDPYDFFQTTPLKSAEQ